MHVVSGSLDTSIRVWDVETGACRHALMGHQSLTSGTCRHALTKPPTRPVGRFADGALVSAGMELKDNILVSGNADSTVKIWDILSGQCLQTLSGTHSTESIVNLSPALMLPSSSCPDAG